jgi:hypothetical protein
VLEKIAQRLAQVVSAVRSLLGLFLNDRFQQFRHGSGDAAVAMLIAEAVQKRASRRLRRFRGSTNSN